MAEENPYAVWERNFRQQMQRLREGQEMTQTDLAKALKSFGLPFHQQTIQRIESGERPVRLNEAHLIAKVLGVTVESMTAAGTPSERELRYAVDRLRRGAATGAEQVNEAMSEWHEDIETLVAAISRRVPFFREEELDDTSRWGVKWALLANNAFLKLWDAWTALAGIEGVDAEMLPFDAVALDVISNWSEALPGTFYTFPPLDGVNTNELYAAFPGDNDGEHQEEA